MTQLVVFLPAVLSLLFIAWSVRLTSRMMGLNKVRWALCFVFAFLLFLVAAVRYASGFALTAYLPQPFSFALGIVFSLAIGTWLFGRYVVAPDGQVLGWKKGATLTAYSFLVVSAPALLLFAVGSIVKG